MATDQVTWLNAQITSIETQIANTNAHMTAILTGAQSYQLNTGQTVTIVTKASLRHVQNLYDWLLTRREDLINQLARAEGTSRAAFNARPSW